MTPQRLLTIGNFPTAVEAHAARLLLGSHGITAIVVDEALVGNFWQFGNAVGGVKLQVTADDAPRARQLLAGEIIPDETPDSTGPWSCGHCRQQVPGNFDVCWSCGEPRGSAESTEPSMPLSESPITESRRPETPPLPLRERDCPHCGTELRAAAESCPECGKTVLPNPYESPLRSAGVRPAPGALRADRAAADELAGRAWRAAAFGSALLRPCRSTRSCS